MRIAVYCNYKVCNNAKDEYFTDGQGGSAEETPPPLYPAILRHSENAMSEQRHTIVRCS